jgi:hypothetical protein
VFLLGRSIGPVFKTGGAAETWLKDKGYLNQTVHSVDVTPAMKKAVMKAPSFFETIYNTNNHAVQEPRVIGGRSITREQAAALGIVVPTGPTPKMKIGSPISMGADS